MRQYKQKGGLAYWDPVYSSVDNCKLCYIDNISITNDDGTDLHPDILQAIRNILKKEHKLMFAINVTRENVLKAVNKHFPLLACCVTPTGYNMGYTYHAVFLNNQNHFRSSEVTTELTKERMKNEKEFLESFSYKCIYKEE